MKATRPVYIVDDDDAVRDSLTFQLQMAGYDAREFASGAEFLAQAAFLPSGCLILDVRMPDMDGLELQTRLKDLRLEFPIIMMTGHADVPIAVRAMKSGAADFLEKPFS